MTVCAGGSRLSVVQRAIRVRRLTAHFVSNKLLLVLFQTDMVSGDNSITLGVDVAWNFLKPRRAD